MSMERDMDFVRTLLMRVRNDEPISTIDDVGRGMI
jgi:hypothetical protein